MDTKAALLQARKELTDAYHKDLQAIDYLLSRLGLSGENARESSHAEASARPAPTRRIARPGSLRDWTERAMIYFNGEVSAPTIYEWAKEQGGEVAADRDKGIAAFAHVLRTMAADGLAEKTQEGSGKRAALYRLVWSGSADSPEQQELTEVSS